MIGNLPYNTSGSGSIEIGIFANLSTPTITTITTAGTYYPIQGTFENDPIKFFGAATVNTPGIKYTGKSTKCFEVDWNAAIEANSNNTSIKIGTSKNGVLSDRGIMTEFLKTSGEVFNCSGTEVFELAENDEIQLVVTSDGSGDIITFDNFTTTIRPFFYD